MLDPDTMLLISIHALVQRAAKFDFTARTSLGISIHALVQRAALI